MSLINRNKTIKKNLEKTIFHVHATQANIIAMYKDEKIEINGESCSLDLYGPQHKVESYSNIFIKDSYKLVAYLYRDKTGGNSCVYAIPEDIDPLEIIKIKDRKDLINETPSLQESLSNFMLAIDGNKTPLSYLQASVLYHELCEYGAYWHGISWGRDTMLPFNHNQEDTYDYKWDMLRDEPETMYPHFYYDEKDNPVAVFYTINDIYTITLNEYIHTFDKESYNLKVIVNTIAEAGTGIVF